MRDIDGIEEAVQLLKPHMAEIEKTFERENQRFIALMGKPHDVIGRLLKCHLIIESYLDRFLSAHYGIEDIESARLGFYNKAMLLPSNAHSAAFVKPGIIQLNTLRNKIGHNLDVEIGFGDLGAMNDVLHVARKDATFKTPIDSVEAFTTTACTWLLVHPKELKDLFTEAFSKIRINRL